MRCTCGITNRPKISYMDDVIRHKLVTGLADADIMQDVLASEIKPLEDTIVFIEGKEGGKKSQQSLSGGGSVNKISEDDEESACRYCGRGGHGSKPAEAVRKTSCPAWGAKCHKCSKLNHFMKCCKSKRKTSANLKSVMENKG